MQLKKLGSNCAQQSTFYTNTEEMVGFVRKNLTENNRKIRIPVISKTKAQIKPNMSTSPAQYTCTVQLQIWLHSLICSVSKNNSDLSSRLNEW